MSFLDLCHFDGLKRQAETDKEDARKQILQT